MSAGSLLAFLRAFSARLSAFALALSALALAWISFGLSVLPGLGVRAGELAIVGHFLHEPLSQPVAVGQGLAVQPARAVGGTDQGSAEDAGEADGLRFGGQL